MLISPAYAQDVNGMLANATQFLPIVLIFIVFYFLLIRPQQQNQKKLKQRLSQRTKDGSNELDVEIAPNVRVVVLRDTVTAVLSPTAANDAKAK
jgi:preprotein translocase subunit YajC